MNPVIEVCEYQEGDLDELEPLHGELILHGDWIKSGYSVTVLYDGQPIACGGVVTLSAGVGTAWLQIDKRVSGEYLLVKNLFCLAEGIIHVAMEKFDLRRVQASCFMDNPKAIKFLRRLGFHFEGTMRNFGPNGEWAWLCARYK